MTRHDIWTTDDIIKVGDAVRDRWDGPEGPVHIVIEVQLGTECAVACKQNAFIRSALDWCAAWNCSAPRWKVLEPVDCLLCLGAVREEGR